MRDGSRGGARKGRLSVSGNLKTFVSAEKKGSTSCTLKLLPILSRVSSLGRGSLREEGRLDVDSSKGMP